ncbi:glycosyltransferase family 32 protein [Priestia megaterium]|uniref:glycosyltransferase family 32 protein n=1 Tax=Priestia megaterium TaxID=1404 RepID=UPI003671CF67
MIPKTIHYCWFGENPLPDLTLKCIESWKKYCPDYKIIEWNESNFDVNSINYTAEAYRTKKYAFVADYVRFEILYQYGGIYLDTDVEIVKPIDDLLQHSIFFGREEVNRVNPGLIMGCEPQNRFVGDMINLYKGVQFLNEDTKSLKTIVDYTTEMLVSRGWTPTSEIQKVEEIAIYPVEFFCPKSYKTGVMTIMENTYTIHHFDSSWFTEHDKKRLRLQQRFNKVLGIKVGSKVLGGMYYLKEYGPRETLKRIKSLLLNNF